MYEVKNWNNLSYVEQIQAQLKHAKDNGLKYELIINEHTVLSKPLIEALEEYEATVLRFNSATKTFTPAMLK